MQSVHQKYRKEFGSSSPALAITISHWLDRFFTTQQLILIHGIWRGQVGIYGLLWWYLWFSLCILSIYLVKSLGGGEVSGRMVQRQYQIFIQQLYFNIFITLLLQVIFKIFYFILFKYLFYYISMCAAAPIPVLNVLDILKVNNYFVNYSVKYDVLFVFYFTIKSIIISRYISMCGFFLFPEFSIPRVIGVASRQKKSHGLLPTPFIVLCSADPFIRLIFDFLWNKVNLFY
eukprot:UN00317